MNAQHIAAFSDGDRGGNPAGVVIGAHLPTPTVMQQVAAELGYSETVFAAPENTEWRVKYFAPQVEIDFCGHATIALGAALAQQEGPGLFWLNLNHARISVEGHRAQTSWGASFLSPPTRSAPVSAAVLTDVLSLLHLTAADLDGRIPPAIANAGGDHLILALKERKTLQTMKYDLKEGQILASREKLVTFNLTYAESSHVFHTRNPFPLGGVYEDPATGAAAAAFGGYLRDLGWPHGGSIVVHQGEDMGVPSRLQAEITSERGAAIRVSGSVREIGQPQTRNGAG